MDVWRTFAKWPRCDVRSLCTAAEGCYILVSRRLSAGFILLETAMAHREQRSNREAKKPKKEKPKNTAAAPSTKEQVRAAVDSRAERKG